MKKSILRTLRAGRSEYIAVKRDGRDVIRVSGHAPTPPRLLRGEKTRYCKNIFLIFVKNAIDETGENSAELAKFIRLKESDNANERKLGEIALNNYIVEIGEYAKKGMNYRIIEGNSDDEVDTAVEKVKAMLKTTVFVPLKYIAMAD